MLRKVLFAVITAVALSITAFSDDGITEILIVRTSSSGGDVIHRSPEQVPIECAFLSTSILVTYLSNLGSVTVELENLTTGEYSQTLVNALPGSSVLPFSGTSGTWTITFTLSGGETYYGTFII